MLPANVLVLARDEDFRHLEPLLAATGQGQLAVSHAHTPEAASSLLEGAACDLALTVRSAHTLPLLRGLRERGVELPVVVVGRGEDPSFQEALADLAPTEFLLWEELSPPSLRLLFRHALRAAQNLEALRQAIRENAQLNAALAALSTGVLVSDPAQADLPILLVNPAFERVTGYPAAEVIGRSHRVLYSPEADPASREALEAGLREHRPVVRTLRLRRRDGVDFWGEVRLNPVRDVAGRLQQVVGLLRDVTPEQETATRLGHNERCVTRLLDRLDTPAAIFQGDVLVLANEAMARLLHAPDPKALSGHALETVAQGLDTPVAEAWRTLHAEAPACGSAVHRRLELWSGSFDLESSLVSHQGLPAVLDVLRPLSGEG